MRKSPSKMRNDYLRTLEEVRRKVSLGGSYAAFEVFIRQEYGGTQGLSKANITKVTQKLKNKKESVEPAYYEYLSKFSKNFDKAADAFILYSKGATPKWYGSRYFVYFYYRPPHTSNPSTPSSLLGRACLYLGDEGEARLVNVPDNKSKGYKGHFRIGAKNLLICSMRSDEESHELTIKVLAATRPPEVCIGSTMSFEGEQLINNIVVLHRVNLEDKEVEEEVFKSAFFTYRDTGFRNVPLEIRKFLALRSLSFLKTPRAEFSLEGLREFRKSHRTSKRAMMVSPQDKPVVYIASPETQLNSEQLTTKIKAIKHIVDSLESELKQEGIDVEFKYPGAIHLEVGQEKQKYRQTIVNTFRQLPYYKYFILIYDEATPSRSLIELGMALQVCVSCLVLYKRGSKFPYKNLMAIEQGELYRPFKMMSYVKELSDSEEQQLIKETIAEMIRVGHYGGTY